MEAGERRWIPAPAAPAANGADAPPSTQDRRSAKRTDRLILADLAHRVFLSFRRRLEQRTIVHDVSANQWRFLRQLWRRNGIHQRALADRLAISEATVAVTLRTLEAHGLVHRRRNAGSRRESLVFLTSRATELEALLLPLARDVHLLATQGFTASEIAALETLLRRVIANLERA